MKKGLIMEGGAMRGMFTAGVTDVLMENGIVFDGAVGVSAGAVFGCNYKSRQIGRVIRYNTKYCNDPRYCGFRSLIKTGNLYGDRFCYYDIPFELDKFDLEAYRKNPMEFYAVATDVETGKPVYHLLEDGAGEDTHWFRASASMPLVSSVVEVGGYRLLDGGISDSVPLKFFESIGYDRNVVILTQPKGFVKEKNKHLPILRMALRKYPKIVEALSRRHEVYNQTTEYIFEKEARGEVFVICPTAPLGIGSVEHKAENLLRVYGEGRRVAEASLSSLKEFLEK